MKVETADQLVKLIAQLVEAMVSSDQVPPERKAEWRRVPAVLQPQINRGRFSPGIDGELVDEEHEPGFQRLVLTTDRVRGMRWALKISGGDGEGGGAHPVTHFGWTEGSPADWQVGDEIGILNNQLPGLDEFLTRHNQGRESEG